MTDLPVYKGKFGEPQAARLLWRAGFGPAPGEARKLARRFEHVRAAVRSLTRSKREGALIGPNPRGEKNLPLAPNDAYGDDVLWWLDRMARTTRPFDERMALIWHDWFATGDVDSQYRSVEQANLFRRRGQGSFLDLLRDVTVDPAMLLWLSGIENGKEAPNENYARELMELFTLGASNEKGYPYSERDVREQARALTGWTADYQPGAGPVNFHFDPSRHDAGTKQIFGKSGAFDWQDACKLCVRHRAHRTFFVEKLWSYFIPKPPSKNDRKALERLYVKRRYAIKPVVEAILMHPKFYLGPAMVKPPIVYIAGLLRARGAPVTQGWFWISELAGQRPFRPPNVAGWDEERWLDTSTFRGRWIAANKIAGQAAIDPEAPYDTKETPKQAVQKALGFWANPPLTARTRNALVDYARSAQAAATADWEQSVFRALRQNALRMLIATAPEMQTC